MGFTRPLWISLGHYIMVRSFNVTCLKQACTVNQFEEYLKAIKMLIK